MKEYFFAFINLFLGNINNRKGLILLGIFSGILFFFGTFSIEDRNAKIFFLILGLISFILSGILIYKEKQ